MNVLYKSREIAYNLTDSDAKAYCWLEGHLSFQSGSKDISPLNATGKILKSEVRS